MGAGLPKAVTSVVVKRVRGKHFNIGLAEMNGWRPAMEDAHVIFPSDGWGFFGVLDGHGGSQCSTYVARRFTEELEQHGMPKDDADMTALALRLDKEFLETGQGSGSTGTFVVVQTPVEAGQSYVLRVSNIGDSRVLLGRADGTMVEGEGTDGCLTIDHKPDRPTEKARIERTGGTVQELCGIPRVNGELAVSRSFGDSQHKATGGPSQEDHPVSAAPEHFRVECGKAEFLMLVCDGISEGSFPNREVVRLAAEKLGLNKDDGPVDPAIAATAVVNEALRCGSRDNLSCMIVLFADGEPSGPQSELLPGPMENRLHQDFRRAYAAMAEHCDKSLPEAIEMRYDLLREVLLEAEQVEGDLPSDSLKTLVGVKGEMFAKDTVEALRSLLRTELEPFGDGPSTDLGSASERTQWFAEWLESASEEERGNARFAPSNHAQLLQFLQATRMMEARDEETPREDEDFFERLTGGTGDGMDIDAPPVEEAPRGTGADADSAGI